MSLNSSEILRHLYSVSRSQIRRDIADCKLQLRSVTQADFLTILVEESLSDHLPEDVASTFHRRMVRANVVNKMNTVAEALRLFCVALATNDIATHAVFAAEKVGRLAELSRMMDEIEEREGMGEDEYWLMGAGPADYQPLSKESDELYDLIFDTAYVTALRRYDLDAVAKLYEDDRTTHDELYEQGRMLIFGPVRQEWLPVQRVRRTRNGIEFWEFTAAEGSES